MEHYKDEEYRSTIITILHDINIQELSPEAKQTQLRRYGEIIVRRLLDFPSTKTITLGNALNNWDKIPQREQNPLYRKGYTEPILFTSLALINAGCGQYAHTQSPRQFTEDDFKKKLDAVFTLYGYVFFKFYQKYEFGATPGILTAFSILPPIIRHITLTMLYDIDDTNIAVIDKLVLSKLKAFDYDTAITWVNQNKEHLQAIVIPPTPFTPSDDMYSCCIKKVRLLKNRHSSIPCYQTFEQVKQYYETNGIVHGDTDEIREFNQLMAFVYIGR